MREAPTQLALKSRPPMPVRRSPVRAWHALLLACITVATVWIVERSFTPVLHPHHSVMLTAARTMQASMGAIHDAKERRGLLVERRHDPNATGLIGPQWTPIVTTYGDLVAKRTATNPDWAAALVGELADASVRSGDVIVTVMSGSLVGANVAVLSAARAMDVRVIALSSLGASMWGATDPTFTWLDMEATLRRAGVLDVHSRLSVLGGDMGVGRGLSEEAAAALRESARRHDVPLREAGSLPGLVHDAWRLVEDEVGDSHDVAAFVNVGGSMLSLGYCRQAPSYPVGLSARPLPCRDGVPGLMTRFSDEGVPVIHILDLDALSLRYGLPIDPRPLPTVGDNRRVYGSAQRP